MSRNLIWIFALLSVVLISRSLQADKPVSSKEKLLEESTNVVTGTVKAIYQRTEMENGWKYTYYVAEIRVKENQKGTGVEVGSLIYVRYWQKQWESKGDVPDDSLGHYPIPDKNDFVRVYLARNSYDGFTFENNDGGYNVIGINGFERLSSSLKK